ncbi:MAG: HD domain-containing protein [Gammaproteobacteria bacterium]|nr:HD domain-containing protein [Gammaproteobacteria bacterium]
MNSINRSEQRSGLHYLATLIFIGIYGIQVCPFIEGLTPAQLATPLILIVGFQYMLHLILRRRMVDGAALQHQVKRTFQLEFSLYILSGIILTISNSIVYDFPVESGLKMILGFATLGLFAAIDLALEHERSLVAYIKEQGITLQPNENYFPLVGKFSLLAGIIIIFIMGIFFLVVVKDLDWLIHVGDTIPAQQAKVSILKEFMFIGGVLLFYVLTVIFSYARNLNLFFHNENSVLAKATAGDLNGSVTVSSNDEFGVMAHHTNVMIGTLLQRTQELQLTQDVTIMSLASLAETRDNETGAHIRRTQRYVKALAEHLRNHPRFSHELNDETIELLFKSAPLHDIGKVGIPDRILLKPGRLDAEEFTIMKTHAELGGEALKVAEAELGSTSFLKYAREIATTHHEKWNGKGYPKGLKGDDIPISGRLMAVADVYDALISKRVYKEAFPHEEAMDILREGRGEHFDPDILDALLEIEPQFVQIAAEYAYMDVGT